MKLRWDVLTFGACALSTLFPTGLVRTETDTLRASLASLASRIDELEVAVARVGDAPRGDAAGSGLVPVSGTVAARSAPVVVPWRPFHAFGVWAVEDDSGHRFGVGSRTQYGVLVEVGPSVCLTDEGITLVFPAKSRGEIRRGEINNGRVFDGGNQ